jgi:hypothetical protein
MVARPDESLCPGELGADDREAARSAEVNGTLRGNPSW